MREFLPRCFGRNPDLIEKQQNNVLSRKTVLRFPLNIFMFSLLYMGGLIGNKKKSVLNIQSLNIQYTLSCGAGGRIFH